MAALYCRGACAGSFAALTGVVYIHVWLHCGTDWSGVYIHVWLHCREAIVDAHADQVAVQRLIQLKLPDVWEKVHDAGVRRLLRSEWPSTPPAWMLAVPPQHVQAFPVYISVSYASHVTAG